MTRYLFKFVILSRYGFLGRIKDLNTILATLPRQDMMIEQITRIGVTNGFVPCPRAHVLP